MFFIVMHMFDLQACQTAAQREGAGGGGLVGKQTQLEGRKGTTKILHILSSLSFTV